MLRKSDDTVSPIAFKCRHVCSSSPQQWVAIVINQDYYDPAQLMLYTNVTWYLVNDDDEFEDDDNDDDDDALH